MYFIADTYGNETIYGENTKILGLPRVADSPQTPADVGLEGCILGTFTQSVAAVAISRRPVAPAGTGPSYVLSRIISQLIIDIGILNGLIGIPV